MAQPRERYDALEVVRPVEPTPEVRRFLAAASEIASIVFENSDSVSLHLNAEDEKTDAGSLALLRRAPVFDHEIYRPGDLKMTLVTFRAPRQKKQNPFYKLYNQLDTELDDQHKTRSEGLARLLVQNALAHDNPKLELDLSFDELNLFASMGNGKTRLKMALVPEMGAGTMQLTEESMICLRAVANANPHLMYPISSGSAAPMVTFMRLPKQLRPEQVTDFYDSLIEKLPVSLHLGEPEVRYST